MGQAVLNIASKKSVQAHDTIVVSFHLLPDTLFEHKQSSGLETTLFLNNDRQQLSWMQETIPLSHASSL